MKNIKWSHELRKQLYVLLKSHTGSYVNQSKADLCKFSIYIAHTLFNDVTKRKAVEFQIKQCLRSNINTKDLDYKTIIRNRIAAIDADFMSAKQVAKLNKMINL